MQVSSSPTTPSSNVNDTNTTKPIYQLDGPYEVKEIESSDGTHCNATIFVFEPAWVSSFSVLYSDNGIEWNEVVASGRRRKVFIGSTESGSVRKFTIVDQSIKVQYVRIVPKTWVNWVCMRVELYGCDSKLSVGISNGLIRQSAITANSSKMGKEPWRGRLNNPFGCWCAAALTDVELYIDLAFVYRLRSFAAQGNPDPMTSEWVTHVSVMYKERVNDDWTFYGSNGVTTVFKTNYDRDGVVKNNFEPKIDASIIKFFRFNYFNAICMRVELYGYRAEMEPLGIENSAIPNDWFASPFRLPGRSRLNGPLAFTFSMTSPPSRFLQVKLGTEKIITGIASKGGVAVYANNFSILYSKDQVFWTYYQEKGITKMFSCNNDGTTKLDAVRNPFTAAYIRIQFNSAITISLVHTGVPFTFEVFGQNGADQRWGTTAQDTADLHDQTLAEGTSTLG
ncbi:venom prothrombin activator oscutarin-C non-catalytic subunit-like [Actinia tenebrosa]|uniref:Venom prothrombin activator oscutarin-C non-catalytic subunit-like n=1 Tax=Actinia tenebrosa TaxID=6105 RepID=A0A6P8GYI6_ACTTE|nr:venom prothrombin activator oscutarin-C non-catalytic subunit-like [Actinia tenebrosa]